MLVLSKAVLVLSKAVLVLSKAVLVIERIVKNGVKRVDPRARAPEQATEHEHGRQRHEKKDRSPLRTPI